MQKSFELNVLLCGDDVVCCSFDEDYIMDRLENLNDRGFEDACEECGRDPEDLTDEEAGEMVFMQSYEGNYYTVDTIDIPADAEDTEGNIHNIYRLSEDEITLDGGAEVYVDSLIDNFVVGNCETCYEED